jgi:hypothetical protein
MLIDLHAHSSGISECCEIAYDGAIRAAKEKGLDGIVLTNHYQKAYVKDGDSLAFAKRYIEEFRIAKAYGDSIGFKVFFGAEVTMEKYGGAHLLLYGITEDFLLENSTLFDFTMQEMRDTVKHFNDKAAIVQAHPYRKVKNLLPVEFLDGVEVNCHPLYGKSDFSDMVKIAGESNLILTCGGDYHADTYRPECGVYLPNTLSDSVELGHYLLTSPTLTLHIQEPNTDSPYDFEWKNPLTAHV